MKVKQCERLISAAEAAHLLGFKSRRGLDRMRIEGRGPRYFRLGNGRRPRVRYRVGDVTSFLQAVDSLYCNQLQKDKT